MAKFDKKWWFIHVPATVVVAGLIAFGVTMCNRLEDAKATKVSVSNTDNLTLTMNKSKQEADAKIDSLIKVQDSLKNVGVKKSDTIRQLKVVVEKQHDSIVGLNNSLSKATKNLKVVKAQLKDCENNMKAQQQQAKKSSKSNARSAVARRAVTDTVRQVVVQAVDTCSNGNATVRVVDTVPAAEVRVPVTCSFRIVTVYGNTR